MAPRHLVDEHTRALVRAVLKGSTWVLGQYHSGIVKALLYMNERCRDVISIEDLCAQAAVSKPHLFRLFREQVGLSPLCFLALLRVEKSKRLLSSRQFSVTEAGIESGFSDLRSFERAFKKWERCTPSEYRNQVLQEQKDQRIQDR